MNISVLLKPDPPFHCPSPYPLQVEKVKKFLCQLFLSELEKTLGGEVKTLFPQIVIGLRFSHYVWYYEQNYRNPWDLLHSIPVVNLNLNRTCPVCTGLPDNSVYWPVPMVQYVALTRLTYYRGQFSWHSPVRGLTMTTPMARSDLLQYPA